MKSHHSESSASETAVKPLDVEHSSVQHYRTIADLAPVLLWSCDLDGVINFSNAKRNALLERSSSRARQRDWASAIHREDRALYRDAVQESLKNKTYMNIEYRFVLADGSMRWLSDHADPFYDEQGRLQGLIGSIVDVTDNRQHLAELRHSHEEAKAHDRENLLIDTMNSYLQVCLSMTETYPVIDYYVRRIFQGCTGAIYLFNENKTVVEPVVEWGSTNNAAKVLEPNDSWALRQGKVHEVQDPGQGMLCNFLSQHPLNGYICAPIIAQGDMIGMLYVEYDKIPEDFNEQEIEHHQQTRRRLVIITADNLALALVSIKLREALKQQSVKDPLTQLYNRRYMSDSLEREFARCRRAQWELSVIILDVDHFKLYNDKFGHDAGDKVLKELAEFIRLNTRQEDIACRYGGEEFLLLMPGATQEEARERAEELREGVKRMNIRHQGRRLGNVAISAGVASYPLCGESETTLFKSADQALYQAKENGRDQVCLAQPGQNGGEEDAEIKAA